MQFLKVYCFYIYVFFIEITYLVVSPCLAGPIGPNPVPAIPGPFHSGAPDSLVNLEQYPLFLGINSHFLRPIFYVIIINRELRVSQDNFRLQSIFLHITAN